MAVQAHEHDRLFRIHWDHQHDGRKASNLGFKLQSVRDFRRFVRTYFVFWSVLCNIIIRDHIVHALHIKRDKFVAIIHSVTNTSEMKHAVDAFVKAGWGDLSVVSDYDEAIPTYWEEQVAYVADMNAGANVVAHSPV